MEFSQVLTHHSVLVNIGKLYLSISTKEETLLDYRIVEFGIMIYEYFEKSLISEE